MPFRVIRTFPCGHEETRFSFDDVGEARFCAQRLASLPQKFRTSAYVVEDDAGRWTHSYRVPVEY